jgi:hypothetical protein
MSPGWYLRRLRRMTAREIAGRLRVALIHRRWANPSRRPAGLGTLTATAGRRAAVALSRAAGQGGEAAGRTIAAADALLAGDWPLFGRSRSGVPAEPDWFADPSTGRRAPADIYCFRIPHRDETQVGNIKFVWEPSRHQATMLLAAAWWLGGREEYAARVASHLTSWWRDNPFLTGIHWSSGIEIGLRLISWCMIRALLADWPGCRALFDDNPVFLEQLYLHQCYLRALPSQGSSANNHLLAELAGLASAAMAFPWFAESADWARWAAAGLGREAAAQTFPDGLNREQASDYHLFVLEILLAWQFVAHLAGGRLPEAVKAVVQRMADAMAASLDGVGHCPRYGDSDEGRCLVLDGPGTDRIGMLLGALRLLDGAAPWWPPPMESVLALALRRAGRSEQPRRPVPRPAVFESAGQALLRSGAGPDEVWLRCDHGPHGFLSIAAHGHADALSLELRKGGVEVLADPGTYCYHGETVWRDYFRGTISHNTLTVAGVDQAVSGGPFLWLTEPRTTLDACVAGEDATRQVWRARHDGYRRLKPAVTHWREVALEGGRVSIEDWIEASQPVPARLAFHFGPAVSVTLEGDAARLVWPEGGADMALPTGVDWRLHRGETDPPLGWYSPRFAEKVPSWTLTGSLALAPGRRLRTEIGFATRVRDF